MFKHYFEQIENIEIYPIISLAVFFLFFVGLIWWVVRADKNYISEMEQMPLAQDDSLTLNSIEHED